MATITKLEELEIWQLARVYSKNIASLLKSDSFDTEYGLKQQMRNASGSVMDNIAEGFGRGSKNEFINHLTIAKGSLEESRSQLYRCVDCGFIADRTFSALLNDSEILVKRITGLINYLNQSTTKGSKFKNRQ
ncbi:MAG: four helix bundle protein [Chitinophagaceae bacterium]|nr:four helix bundle protein [Chitinophagaceae bacterium]